MRVRNRLLTLASATAALAVVLAACGGSDATATPVPQPTATPRPTVVVPTPTPPPVAPPTATSAAPTATRAPGAPTAVPSTATSRPAVTATPVPTATRAAPTATPAGPAPKYGGTFRMRTISDFPDLDSRTSNGQFSTIWMLNLLNNLITYQPDDAGKVLGELADTWKISDNGLVWAFNLRKDVKWQDGTQFTAKDVIFSFNAYLKPEGPAVSAFKSRMAAVDKIEAPDDYTFVMTLSRPSASLLAALTVPSVMIYPAKSPFTQDAWKKSPYGTGPYTFKSYEVGSVRKLAKSPGYWRKDAAGRALPYMDALEYYTIVDATTLAGAFASGRLDCLCGYGSDLPITDLDKTKARVPGLKFGILRAASIITLHLNSRPPFDNQKVRQAFNIAFDRKEANAAFLGGQGYYPPGYLLPPGAGGQWGLTDQELLKTPGFREPKAQDITLAKQLLRESGVDPAGKALTVLSSSRFSDQSAIADSELKKLGFAQSKIVLLDNLADIVELRAGNFDLNILQFGLNYDDPNDQLQQVIIGGGARNWGKWNFPDVDTKIDQQDRIIDPAKRKEAIYDLQRRVLDLATTIPFLDQVSVYATQPYVIGFYVQRAIGVGPAHKLEKVWLDK